MGGIVGSVHRSRRLLDFASGGGENPGMLILRPGALIVLLVLAAACAGPAAGPEAMRGIGPCLPPEVSPRFFFWPVIAFRTINLVTEDGEATEASWVLYRRGRSSVAVVWVHSDLISVDASPETETPEWIDISLVTPVDEKLVLRRTPEAPCQWKRWEDPADAQDQSVRLKLALTMSKVFLPAGS
jgi:hypothetical protein